MLKRLFILPVLFAVTACGTAPSSTPTDPAARRALMEALPTSGSCQPAEPQGARACTIRLGSKDARFFQSEGVTTIRYREADTAEPAFLNDMRRVLTTAGTPDIERAMSVIASHGRSGAMNNFTSGCFPETSEPPTGGCFVTLSY